MVTTTAKNAIGQTYSYRQVNILASHLAFSLLLLTFTNPSFHHHHHHHHHHAQFVYTENTQYTFIYLLFCWFWTSEFIIAMGQLTIALSLVAWYFTRDKSKIGNATVIWAMKTAFRYHMGTAAFGSMIIAIIKTARAIVAYMQKHAKATKNKVMEYLLCVLQCCMWCLEKFMKFVNKNAYIQTALYGYSFCKSARCAFFLILRNILRVGAVNVVGDFVLMLGKLLVPLVSTFIAYLIIAYGIPSNSINFILAPLALVWLLSYFVSCMFSEIFGMSIETILCCFIADEEMFPAGNALSPLFTCYHNVSLIPSYTCYKNTPF